MKKTTFLIAVLMTLSSFVNAQQVTIYGASGITDGTGYTNLTAAFTALNGVKAAQSTKDITVKINESTTETASATLNAGTWNSVTVYPTVSGLTVSGSIAAAPLILLSGGNKLTIDGRVNATGDVVDLTIDNTNAGATASTVRFINDAINNSIRYCKLKGSGQGSGYGIIWFSTAAASGIGNNNNTVEYNEITTSDNANRPYNTIYGYGTSGIANTGNTIRFNKIYNFLNPGLASIGVYVRDNCTNWSIQGNSFYETALFTTTATTAYNIILIGGSGNTGISNITTSDNYIGGQSAQCGGSAWTKNGNDNIFNGIYLNAGVCSVQNNTIKNISWTNSGSASAYMIYANAGTLNIGTTTGNTIGSVTVTGNINFTSGATAAIFYGIYVPSTGTVDVQKNSIGGITLNSSNAAYATNFYGIYKKNVAGTITISNNKIGSETVANSIDAAGTSTGNAQTVDGIYSAGTGTTTISGNTVTNLTNSTTNTTTSTYGWVHGINITSIPAGTSAAVTNNIIRDLKTANLNSNAYEKASVLGILCTFTGTTGANHEISGNTISNLFNTNSSFAGGINGIYFNGAEGTHTIKNNFISNLTVNDASVGASIYGINVYGGAGTSTDPAVSNYINNIVYLGGNTDSYLYGIYCLDNVAYNDNTLYYNTVYITGTPGSETKNSYALISGGNLNTRVWKNNNLVNMRTGANNMNYAVKIQGVANYTSDYNNFFSVVSTNLGYYSGSKDFATWRTLTLMDANSKNINPAFTITNPLVANAFYPGNGSLTTTNVIGLVTTDYAGTTRNATNPTIGALEFRDSTTETLTPETDNSIRVYSNAPGKLTVICDNNRNSISQITIFNITGQKILQRSFSENRTIIDLPVTAGVYVVNVVNAGKSVTCKITFN